MAYTVTAVAKGDSIPYTPGTAVDAGDVVVQADLLGVATQDIAANALGALSVEGIFAFPKATTSASAIAAGTKLYWNASSQIVSTSSGDGKLIGKATEAAAAAASTVNVKLDQ